MFDVQIILTNEFGQFCGKKIPMTGDQYKEILNMAKMFYTSGGFELHLEDGSYIVLPPSIVQKTILKITKQEIDGDDIQEQI